MSDRCPACQHLWSSHHPTTGCYAGGSCGCSRTEPGTPEDHLPRLVQGRNPHVERLPHFDGPTYDPAQDQARLTGQMAGVYGCLASGGWWTLRELHDKVGGSEAGISARIRDLRKDRFGGHDVPRRRRSGGLWEYALKR